MTIAVFESRLGNFGGGGRHALRAAIALAGQNDVEMWHTGQVDPEVLRARWNVPLERIRLVGVPDDDAAISARTAGLDGFINAAQGRFIHPRAKRSVFLSFFPTGIDLSAGGRMRWGAGSVLRVARLGRALPPTLRARLSVLPTRAQVRALAAYDAVWVNSAYSQRWATHYWHRDAEILYPPIDPVAPLPKTPTILHVGRFFVGGHNKRHDVLIEAFRALLARLPSGAPWRLVLAGSITPGDEHHAYARHIEALAAGLPVDLRFAPSHHEITGLIGRAALYWHAAGYGVDLQRYPDRAEHFGMSIVEAMTAAAVPVVFGAGGPAEIVTDGVDGQHWQTPAALVEQSLRLIDDPPLRERLGAAARLRSAAFTLEAFDARTRALWAWVTR